MTRRERLERKAERRREWADSARRKSDAGFNRAHEIGAGIPLGQPILVGHHSEKRHRRDVERIDAGMRAGVENMKKANDHVSKAGGLEDQLARSIFSDDPDAVEALEAKAAELDGIAEQKNAINRAWRKHAKLEQTGANSWGVDMLALPALLSAWEALGVSPPFASQLLARALEYSWTRRHGPCDSKNVRANARRLRLRIKDVQRRKQRTEAAAAAGGVLIQGEDYVSITFDDFPGRETINKLKAAGFHWSGGSWHGRREHLPEGVAP